jgi:putative transposase
MKKTDLALSVIARRGFAVKTTADTLGVSRSQLHSSLREGGRPRGRYEKLGDAEVLAPTRTLTGDRPTHGYRRIWALFNRQGEQAGQTRLHHKSIHRLMSQNGLLLQRYTGKPPGRSHDGQIITICPNLRWTSDGFEIACWNGQRVPVAFALDTCDREVMSWVATTGGISGEMIRDLMLESVERRFNSQQTPHPVECLSDDGVCYSAHETISFAQSIGLVPCFTWCDRHSRMKWPSPS